MNLHGQLTIPTLFEQEGYAQRLEAGQGEIAAVLDYFAQQMDREEMVFAAGRLREVLHMKFTAEIPENIPSGKGALVPPLHSFPYFLNPPSSLLEKINPIQ